MATHYARTVGHIDELLVMIFAHLDDRALSRAACVCKHWSEIALDSLWHEVHDLRRALAVLAPLALKPERAFTSTGRPPNAYAFRRPLTPDDWQRFRRYSIRVRRIRHDQRRALTTAELARRHVPLHSKIFDDLSTTCPYPDIFPNLQSLIWFSCAPERQHFSLTFMHRRVKHLGLHLYRSGSSTGFLHQVCLKCIGVTSLEVRMEVPVRQLEDDVLILLRGLCHLQQVSFPAFSITPRILAQLSVLRCLDAISLGHPAQAQPGDRTDVAEFSPTIIAEDGFVTLRSLAFGAQVPDATRLLNTALFPAKLTRLHLKSVATASPAVVRDFFCAIQKTCTSLVNLSVDYIIAPDSALVSPPPALRDRPTLATFRPLFYARALRIFEFRWDFALNLSDDDMDEFASSWPSLESLQLNPEPVPEPNGPKLSLRALVPFAKHCANLRYLALHVDARTPLQDIPPRMRAQRLAPFQRLETFAVGLSTIAKPEPVTLFLSQLLPLGCAVRCGLRWPDAFDLALEHALVSLDVRTEMSAFWMRWTEVAKMLPITTKARLEEKASFAELERRMHALEVSRTEDRRRLSDLEREVVDLRGRTGRTP
ncbi:hypothetical protein C8Q79DRAFT_915713 [Trametes meyenii]|nr:hypothetical protein C8Q79DRAFT_915713 [Trametes meyenii]